MVDEKGTSTRNRKLRQNHHNIGRHRFICDKIFKSVRLLDGKHAFIYRTTDDAYILGKKSSKEYPFRCECDAHTENHSDGDDIPNRLTDINNVAIIFSFCCC